ncbi:MAG: SET domain-containing protein-lysine N-methyltransferase [Chlamydiota bacterium]
MIHIFKKPLFKKPEVFLEELLRLYGDKPIQDAKGDTLAHLCIQYEKYNFLPRLKTLLDIPNHAKVTPRQLLDYLDLSHNLIQDTQSSLAVYRTKEKRLDCFSDEEILKNFNFRYSDMLKFQKFSYLKWVNKECHKYLLANEVRKQNHWKTHLYGINFTDKRVPKVYVKWINPLVGYGLFALEDIPSYTWIGEYTGVIRKRNRHLDQYNNYIFGYVVASADTPFVIDAQNQGNYTRFINHSDEPNLRSTWLVSDHIGHIILVTQQKILKHTQLTYDYGMDYWKKRTAPFELA